MLKNVCSIIPLFLKVYEIVHGNFLSYKFLHIIVNYKMLFCYSIDRSSVLVLLVLKFPSLLYPIFKYYDFLSCQFKHLISPRSSYITLS
jgi:hypothetical protein